MTVGTTTTPAMTGMPLETQQILAEAAERFGTPSYVYFLDDIIERAALINRVFGGLFEISYAVKANPNRALLRGIDSAIGGLDVSSGGELLRGLECGYAPERLSFSGPGKSLAELALAVDRGCGEVIVESVQEMIDLEALARDRKRRATVVIRVCPQSVPKGFGVSMGRRPSQFGIDEETLDDALKRLPEFKHLSFAGFHIYAGAQCLDVNSITENFENYIRIFTEFAERHNLACHKLIFGGGIGIPYHAGDVPVDLEALAFRMNALLEALRARPLFKQAQFRLEIGRLLVGEAGYFLTGVRRMKKSRGKEIAICDGGLNNHLAACGHFGSIIHRNYIIEKLGSSNEPGGSATPYDIFGPLCTTIDQLARDMKFPSLKTGDVLAVRNSGAYGYSASPMQFISHPPAKEIMAATKNGKMEWSDISEQYSVEQL
jgi:diaminopimelate decarboxylase